MYIIFPRAFWVLPMSLQEQVGVLGHMHAKKLDHHTDPPTALMMDSHGGSVYVSGTVNI